MSLSYEKKNISKHITVSTFLYYISEVIVIIIQTEVIIII